MKDLVSVPQQGLLIMNCKYEIFSKIAQRSFRPQQGLLIMNSGNRHKPYAAKITLEFPSPTGATYYECLF